MNIELIKRHTELTKKETEMLEKAARTLQHLNVGDLKVTVSKVAKNYNVQLSCKKDRKFIRINESDKDFAIAVHNAMNRLKSNLSKSKIHVNKKRSNKWLQNSEELNLDIND